LALAPRAVINGGMLRRAAFVPTPPTRRERWRSALRQAVLIFATLIAVAAVGVAAFVSHPSHLAHAHGVHPYLRMALRTMRYTHRGMGFAILAVMVISRLLTRRAPRWAEPVVAVSLSVVAAMVGARLAELRITEALVEQAALAGSFGALAGMTARWLDGPRHSDRYD
jgi:hypothetical protein